MNKIIDFFVISFVLDFLILLLLKLLHKLSVKWINLLILQILNIMVGVIYIFCNLLFYQFLLMKILSNFLICLLITEEYKLSKIFVLFGSYVINSFSVYGASIFLTEFFKAAYFELFHINITEIYTLSVFFAEIVFIFAIFAINKAIFRDKKNQKFISKVSFMLNGKHINITGLLDSGNSLYDTKTGNPVIVVSSKVLKNVLSKKDYLDFVQGRFELCGATHLLSYVCVGGTECKMPIIENVSVTFCNQSGSQKHKCAIGFIDQSFCNNSFECLVHKDFV